MTTLLITFRQVQEQPPLSGSLLKLIACIGRQNIPHEFLVRNGLEGADDEISLCEAISKLLNFSLITMVQHKSAYEIHSLVHVSFAVFLKQGRAMDNAPGQPAQPLSNVLPDGCFQN